MHKRCAIGIDLGGTKTLLVLFDEKYKIIEEIKFKTAPETGERAFTLKLNRAVENLTRLAKKKELLMVGVGLGCAGYVEPRTRVLHASPNIPFLKNYPFGKRLEKIAGVDVVLGNDVQMGLYGEHQLGVAKGYSHVIGVFFGTGIGGAVIIDGKLHLGASGAAGEIGRFLMQPMGPLAGSERHGTLDQVVSKTAIAGEALALAAKQWAPYLYKIAGTDLSKINAGIIGQAIRNGDQHIEELVRSRARMAGIALSNLVNFLSPDMVVLGGGLTEAMPKIILKEVESGIREFSDPIMSKDLKVAVAALKDHAVTTGAAKLAFDKFAKPG